MVTRCLVIECMMNRAEETEREKYGCEVLGDVFGDVHDCLDVVYSAGN